MEISAIRAPIILVVGPNWAQGRRRVEKYEPLSRGRARPARAWLQPCACTPINTRFAAGKNRRNTKHIIYRWSHVSACPRMDHAWSTMGAALHRLSAVNAPDRTRSLFATLVNVVLESLTTPEQRTRAEPFRHRMPKKEENVLVTRVLMQIRAQTE